MENIYDLVMARKSVRTFDGNSLRTEDTEKILRYAETVDNPFGVSVRFQLLDPVKNGLKSPVLTGETCYLAGICEKAPHAEAAFGYAFEKVVLYAWSLGIGTVWIGGTMNRDAFEKAVGLHDNERMPCVTPLGYPARKRSVKEIMMRKGLRADTRKPVEELFFQGTWDRPLSKEETEPISDLIEMVRWAPSAVNKQPWRILLKDGVYHFYEKRDKGYVSEAVGDMQKIDVGIALCHFALGLEARGEQSEIFAREPAIEKAADLEYVASVSK